MANWVSWGWKVQRRSSRKAHALVHYRIRHSGDHPSPRGGSPASGRTHRDHYSDGAGPHVADRVGTPQVWITPTKGGWPNQVTALEDPVTQVEWSPAGTWLAISIAPGGGMNTHIYVVHPDGSGLKRYSQGGKDNNWLAGWTHAGSELMVSSNVHDGAAMDPYLLGMDDGQMRLVSRSPGMDNFVDVGRDNHIALVQRMQSRGNNNVYWVDVVGHTEVNLTAHEGPGTFDGRLSPDGHTAYLISNKDRDLTVFAKEQVGAHGEAGVTQIVAQRPDADLAEFEITRTTRRRRWCGTSPGAQNSRSWT